MTPADGAAQRVDSLPPFKPLPMKGPVVEVTRRADGSVLIASAHAPGDMPFTIAHLLADKAIAHPDRPFILQRAPGHGPWGAVTYGQAKRDCDGIGQWLLDQGLSATDSVLISTNP